MWHELGRGIRTAWAVNIWGWPLVSAMRHLDYGSTVVLLERPSGFWWLLAPSLN